MKPLSRRGVLAGALALGVGRGARAAPSTFFDIGSGGTPSLTGSHGGAITVYDGNLLADLNVVIDFGDCSPINRNAAVRAAVPIAIRTERPYELTISAAVGNASAAANALQLSDIGFGIQNPRMMASGQCSNHLVLPPFDNEPSQNVTYAPRATFASTLATAAANPLAMRGPRSSKGKVQPRQPENGWVVDAVFVVVPQFFLPGSLSVSLTFQIREGPNVACN